MPNEVDQDRIAAKTVDLKVVDLEAYRASRANDAGKSFLAPEASNALTYILAVALVIIVGMLLSRARG